MEHKKNNSVFIFAFPILLSIGIFLIPVVSDYSNHEIATAAINQTARWFAGHIIAAVAFGFSILSVKSIADHLKSQSYHLPDFILIIMAVGAGLYAAGLGADGIGPIAVKSSGGDPLLFFDGSGWWVSGTFAAATAFYGIGLISLIGHINNQGMLRGMWRYIAFFSALVMVTIPAIPSGWGLYGEAVASFGVFFPLGFALQRVTKPI